MRRFLGPAITMLAAVIVGAWAVADLRVRASFPLATDGAYTTSPTLIGQAGLYQITLEMDVIRDRTYTYCLMGGELLPHPDGAGTTGTEGCEVTPRLSADWKLYSGRQLVAQSGPQSMYGADAHVGPVETGDRVSIELGTIRLEGFRSYRLEIRETDAPPVLAAANPVVHVTLHPWHSKDALGRAIFGVAGALLLGLGAAMWLGIDLRQRDP